MKCWKEKSNQQLRKENLNSTTMYVTSEKDDDIV